MTPEEIAEVLALANSGPNTGRFPKSGYKGISETNNPKYKDRPWRVSYKGKDIGYFSQLEDAKACYAEAYVASRPVEHNMSRSTDLDANLEQPLKDKRMNSRVANSRPGPLPLVLKRKNPLLDVTHPDFGKLVEERVNSQFRAEKKRLERASQVLAPITSIYAGVTWAPRQRQWRAKYNTKVIGYYTTEVKAAEAYAEVRKASLEANLPRSGYRGVSWHAPSRKWVAQRQGKSLGYYADAYEAHLAYIEAGELTWTKRRLAFDTETMARQELARAVQLNESSITRENSPEEEEWGS